MEDRLDTLSSTLLVMKELLVKSGISEPDSRKAGNSPAEVKTSGKSGNDNKLTTSRSEMTIYENALENLGKVNEQIVDSEITFRVTDEMLDKQCYVETDKRDSTSSEKERIDTSDEIIDTELDINEKFIAGQAKDNNNNRKRSLPPEDEERDIAEGQIRQAEASKIRMLSTLGRRQSTDFIESRFNGAMAMQHSSMVDECYISVGGNIDQGLREKICRGEYVDFARLLLRNKLGNNPSEQKVELINKGGQTFFVPANDKDSLSVSSFHHWEQAFRVYSNIYLQDHQDHDGQARPLV